jgi:monothiol glutaredoxin
MSADIRTRIDSLLEQNRVVLFMKGTRHSPRCGFSAGTAGLLNELLDDYVSVDVLEDPAIREGIKAYGNWPTIPQLYVDKELVGGADIVQSMYNTGELHGLFGLAKPDRTPPELSITDAAAEAIRAGLADAGDASLHLSIDARFQAQFFLRPADGGEIRSQSNGIDILFDTASAQRARGIVIDWVESMQGAGLSIQNPNAPKPVQPLDVQSLQQRLVRGDITVIDVRPPQDRALAPFAAARVLDEDSQAQLAALPKETPLAFLCHHGNSSRSAAEHFRGLGFRDVYNVEGGIDAWSREVDAKIPRY